MKIWLDPVKTCEMNYQWFEYYTELHDYLVDDINDADTIVVPNTCCCTADELAKTFLRLDKIRKENQAAAMYVTGCITRPMKEDILNESLYYWLHPDKKIKLVKSTNPGLLLKHLLKDKYTKDPYEFGYGYSENDDVAHLYIQTGCLNNCTFCKSTYQELTLKSATLETIKEYIDKFNSQNQQTLYLQGTNIAQYGLDLYNEYSLPKILDYIETKPNIRRIGLIGLAFKDVIKANMVPELLSHPKIGYINGSLESGSNRILKLMNKGFSKEQATSFIKSLSDKQLGICIISGFPTETQEDINDTLDVLSHVKNGSILINEFKTSPFIEANNYPQFTREEIKEHTKIYQKELSKRPNIQIRIN